MSIYLNPKVVKNNERYKITDMKYEGLTISKTELRTGQETRGHSHPNPETYFFKTEALLLIQSEYTPDMINIRRVNAGDMIAVPGNLYHKVRTLKGRTAAFISVFQGTREGNKADYGTTKG